MKALLVALVLFFQADSLFAGSCRTIEHAELKDMSSEGLVQTYCRYGKSALQDHQQVMAFMELQRKALSQGQSTVSLEGEITKLNASADGCNDQQSKISSALRNRSEPDNPNCEGM